eukprot:162929_1
MLNRASSLLKFKNIPSLITHQYRLFSTTKTKKETQYGGGIEAEVSPYTMYYPKIKANISWQRKITEYSDSKQQKAASREHELEKEAEKQIEQDDYDMIIDCDQLLNLNKNGWPIHIKADNELWYDVDHQQQSYFKGHKRFMPEKENLVRTVAVSGIFNTGKTFFVNNLCSMDLPSSDSVSTKGLSMKRMYGASKDILILDTAGSNSAIEMINEETSLSDKISSEKILQNTIYDVANFHICVVNKLTWP